MQENSNSKGDCLTCRKPNECLPLNSLVQDWAAAIHNSGIGIEVVAPEEFVARLNEPIITQQDPSAVQSLQETIYLLTKQAIVFRHRVKNEVHSLTNLVLQNPVTRRADAGGRHHVAFVPFLAGKNLLAPIAKPPKDSYLLFPM